MFKCVFCGLENPSDRARFCGECGPEGPAKDWVPAEIDQPTKIAQYIGVLSEFYFDASNQTGVEKFSIRLRERLKISHAKHVETLASLAAKKKAIAHLAEFRIEFNENVRDAYAGHDTYLNFRFSNLSDTDLFKVSLDWDDPETTDRIDLKAETRNFVKPRLSATLGASVIFDRMGIKEIAELKITVADQFGESATFRAEPFRFKVGNHDQKITQHISTHNQISIEGRGVVDASGMGAEKPVTNLTDIDQPKWTELRFNYIYQDAMPSLIAVSAEAEAETQQSPSTTITPQVVVAEFGPDNLRSVLAAAEQGNEAAQYTLGTMYEAGSGVARDDQKAVHWYRMAAKQGNALAQVKLGTMFESGSGVSQDDEEAVYWYRKAAEQGNARGQSYLGAMYENGSGVSEDDEKAAYWYQMSADQGDAFGQYNLGTMYERGLGVAQDGEEAVYWYELAASEQDYNFLKIRLGAIYEEGVLVDQDHEQAVHWYRMAADMGLADGQYHLGRIYEEGVLVDQDHEQAVHWYRMAADMGSADGQYHLGRMYQEGTGVAENTAKALYWYRKAAEQDDERAVEALESLDEVVNTAAVPPTDGFGSWDYGEFIYKGEYKNGYFHGYGECNWTGEYSGHKYEGSYENGARHGFGEYTFPDGTIQVGKFINNVFVPEDSDEPQSGSQTTPVDWHYVGPWSNDVPHGVGMMKWANGDVYIGDFVYGVRHGIGEFKYSNGTVLTGRFENDVFVRNASFLEQVKIGYMTSQWLK